jgi:hypothetical protein
MSNKTAAFLIFIALAASIAAAFLWHSNSDSHSQSKKPAQVASGQTVNSPPNHQAASKEIFAVASDGWVSIPPRFQLPRVTRTKSGVNSREWLGQYPLDQQEKFRAFSKAHFGVYSINSPKQVAWMADNGYPMPEDILAAASMTDAQLRELAAQGNDKAGFLLRERTVAVTKEKLEEYRALGKTESEFWSSEPIARQLSADEAATTQLLQQSHSPFKGYVQANDSLLKSSPQEQDATVIAGLEWANSLGDFRAAQFLEAFVGNDPIREAMVLAAGNVSSNGALDSTLIKSTGCQNAGVSPDMYIPGTFEPVE